jgi:hypothetical protein
MSNNERMAEYIGTAKRQLTEEEMQDNMWDNMIQLGIATQKELELVSCLNGYSMQTLNDVLYAKTGYRSLGQMWEEYKEK